MEPQATADRSVLESFAWHLALGLGTAFIFCFVLLLGWGLGDDPVVVELVQPPDPIIGVWDAGNYFTAGHSMMIFQRNGRGRAGGYSVDKFGPNFSYSRQGTILIIEVSGEHQQYRIEELTESELVFGYGIENYRFKRLKGKDLNKALRWLDDPDSLPPF